MYRRQVRRRRLVLVALVVVALVMVSLSFSEARSGPLHSIQRGISTVLSPIEEGASRALKPARDLVDWVDETFAARGVNEELRAENAELRRELADAQQAVGDNDDFRRMLELDDSGPLAAFEPVTARVIGRSPSVWYATVQVDQGSDAGVEPGDAVITGDGLAGRITDVGRGSSQVSLITDHRSAVSVEVLPDGPSGVVEPELGDPDDLLLDFIENDEPVQEGAMLVTAGWTDGEISSAFPPDIPLGEVSETGAGEQEAFQRIHVKPYADIRGMDYVQVLTGGPERPGVGG